MGSNEPGALPRGLPEQNQKLKGPLRWAPPAWERLHKGDGPDTGEGMRLSGTSAQDGWTKTMEPRPEGAAPLCNAMHLAGQEDKEAL